MTVDLDVLDPSVMSGTGTPESGGMQFNELMGWFEYLKTLILLGLMLWNSLLITMLLAFLPQLRQRLFVNY